MPVSIIWDFEGPVINVERDHEESWNETAREMNIPFGMAPDWIGTGDTAISQYLAKQAQLAKHEITAEDFAKTKKALFFASVRRRSSLLREGALETLEGLYSDGYPMGIASLTPPDEAAYYFRRADVGRFFNPGCTVFRDDVPQDRLKPFPDVYLEAIRRLKADPKQTVVVEDSVPGVKAAVSAGVARVLGVPVYPQTERALREAGATDVILSLDLNTVRQFVRALERK